MENNKEKLEAMENTQNSPAALSDEQLGTVTGAIGDAAISIPAPAYCDVCGSTNIVSTFNQEKGCHIWVCGDCGELLAPCYYVPKA